MAKSKAKKKSVAIKKSICLPGDVLKAAEEMAAKDGRNLSNYLQQLVRADLEKEKVVIA